MRELYIYYRVDEAHVAAARHAVEAMHDRLREAHPGLVARLLTRLLVQHLQHSALQQRRKPLPLV